MKSVLLKSMALIIIALVATSTVAVAQQKGDKAVGVNLLLGSGDSFSNYGVGAKFLYNVTDPIRVSAEFDYFLKKDHISMWDASVYGHYLFPVNEQFTLYPSVGLGFINTKASIGGVLGDLGDMLGIDTSASSTDFAFSLGGGAEYKLTDKMALNGELRYKIKDGNRLNIVVGVAYKF